MPWLHRPESPSPARSRPQRCTASWRPSATRIAASASWYVRASSCARASPSSGGGAQRSLERLALQYPQAPLGDAVVTLRPWREDDLLPGELR